jgi:threonine aldolase
MRIIDLRSDTVTQPTQEMRDAMFGAEVGDDVYGDDPQLNELEKTAAEMLGKEAALFVPSGTMGNQLCAMTHTRRGDEVIASHNSHIVEDEVSGLSVMSGLLVRSLYFKNGIPDRASIEKAIRGEDIHYPSTGLICLENPTAGGRTVSLSVMEDIYGMARSRGIKVHVDGARLFNAAAALGCDVKDITAKCDSVMACISKGLCAPVGSVIAGDEAFIKAARKNRKMLGGGMRQAGFLGAAALIGLKVMSKRVGCDNENAKDLARKLNDLPCVSIDLGKVDVNMIFFRIDKPADFLDKLPDALMKSGIRINGHTDGEFRFVTHHGVTAEDCDTVIEVLHGVLA